MAFYVDYHARETYDVIEQKITVSPEIAELVLRRVKDYGAVPKAMCTAATSSRSCAGFPGSNPCPRPGTRKSSRMRSGRLPGVTTRVITDDDDDSNHGVLLVQANGDSAGGLTVPAGLPVLAPCG